jgi:8-oxo-dGTP pyrophosphatase MutT (NUDIX family)
MMTTWKVLASKSILDNAWFRIRQDTIQLPNGDIIDDYFVWQNADVSLVVPRTKDGKFVLVRQYKHGIGRVCLEFPAGYLNTNETPESAAERETKEETGYSFRSLTLLTTLTNNPTKETSRVYVFLAEDAQKTDVTRFDTTEAIETVLLTPQQVIDHIHNGDIILSASIVAAYIAFEKLGIFRWDTPLK